MQNCTFNFEKLTVYQKALDAIDKVYEYTDTFPREELYGLSSQFRRAVVSIAVNIAEGSARSRKDFCRFLDIAQGSIFECTALLTICQRKAFIGEKAYSQLRSGFEELSRMTSGLKRGIGFDSRKE